MSLLPRVTEKARELIAREFDARGPDVCTKETIDHLEHHNPELLDMAVKWAADLEAPDKAMVGFSMFYRLLIGQVPTTTDAGVQIVLPRVSAETRDVLVAEIDRKGSDQFTREAIAELEESNPELLQMAHNFLHDWEIIFTPCRASRFFTSPFSFNRERSARGCTNVWTAVSMPRPFHQQSISCGQQNSIVPVRLGDLIPIKACRGRNR